VVIRLRRAARARRAGNHRDGPGACHHQAPGASVVHPDHAEVLPPGPEPARNGDGPSGNGRGRDAGRRLLEDLRREHPHTGATVVEDALSSNGPHINPLKERDFRPMSGGGHGPLPAGSGPCDTEQAWERRDGKAGTVQGSGWDRGPPPDGADAGPGPFNGTLLARCP